VKIISKVVRSSVFKSDDSSLISKSNEVLIKIIDCCYQFNKIVKEIRYLLSGFGLTNFGSLLEQSGVSFAASDEKIEDVEELLKKLSSIQSEAIENLRQSKILEGLIRQLANAPSVSLNDLHVRNLRHVVGQARTNSNDIPKWIPQAEELESIPAVDREKAIQFLSVIVSDCWSTLIEINKSTIPFCRSNEITEVYKMPEKESEISVYEYVYVP